MAYDDSFYYGQCRIMCTTSDSSANGKTVVVTASGGSSKSGVVADGKVEFLVPPRDHYTVKLMDGDAIKRQHELDCGYGECITVDIGYDVNSPLGIKEIVNKGLEAQYFKAGDQIMFKEGQTNVAYDVLHVDYFHSRHGHNVIFGRHAIHSNNRFAWNVTDDITNSVAYKFLNNSLFNSYSEDLRNSISVYTQSRASTSNGGVKTTVSKIWLPNGTNVVQNEAQETQKGEYQFDYFKSLANRIKNSSRWWLSSGETSTSSSYFRFVETTGSMNYADSGSEYGIVPCFMIAADK